MILFRHILLGERVEQGKGSFTQRVKASWSYLGLAVKALSWS